MGSLHNMPPAKPGGMFALTPLKNALPRTSSLLPSALPRTSSLLPSTKPALATRPSYLQPVYGLQEAQTGDDRRRFVTTVVTAASPTVCTALPPFPIFLEHKLWSAAMNPSTVSMSIDTHSHQESLFQHDCVAYVLLRGLANWHAVCYYLAHSESCQQVLGKE